MKVKTSPRDLRNDFKNELLDAADKRDTFPGFRVQSSGFKVQGFWFKVSGFWVPLVDSLADSSGTKL
jgi:hypothetical protein